VNGHPCCAVHSTGDDCETRPAVDIKGKIAAAISAIEPAHDIDRDGRSGVIDGRGTN